MTPLDRACLEYALRVIRGLDVYVAPNGLCLALPDEVFRLDPSGDHLDAVTAMLAQVMKLHLGGTSLAELFEDLSRMGVGEELVDRVKYHTGTVFCDEWADIRARANWYETDKTQTMDVSTEVEGVS